MLSAGLITIVVMTLFILKRIVSCLRSFFLCDVITSVDEEEVNLVVRVEFGDCRSNLSLVMQPLTSWRTP